jgi:hypothetical protein
VKFLVFEQATGLDRFKSRLGGYEYASKQVNVEYIDADKYPLRAKEYEIQQYGTVVVESMGPQGARDDRLRAGPHQRAHQGPQPDEEEDLLPAGHGEKDTASQASDRGGSTRLRRP